MQTFDFSLSLCEVARTREFFDRLDAENRTYFNSDLFREWQLDKYFTDKQHEIGAFFAKLKANGFIVSVGEEPSVIPSNNRRKNGFC